MLSAVACAACLAAGAAHVLPHALVASFPTVNGIPVVQGGIPSFNASGAFAVTNSRHRQRRGQRHSNGTNVGEGEGEGHTFDRPNQREAEGGDSYEGGWRSGDDGDKGGGHRGNKRSGKRSGDSGDSADNDGSGDSGDISQSPDADVSPEGVLDETTAFVFPDGPIVVLLTPFPSPSPSTSPSPSPSPSPVSTASASASDNDENDSACFPGGALVNLRGGGAVPMRDVRVGDVVSVGPGAWSTVFMFTHSLPSAQAAYIEITAADRRLRVSPGHLVYASGGMVEARSVRRGDVVEAGDGRPLVVDGTRTVTDVGVYNPQTLRGDIVVDGVRASCYTTAVDACVAHGALAGLRALWTTFGIAVAWFEGGMPHCLRTF